MNLIDLIDLIDLYYFKLQSFLDKLTFGKQTNSSF